MKRFVLITLAALVLCGMTGTAFAKSAGSSSSQPGMEVDGSLVLASSPASGFDTGYGVTFGFGTMLPQLNRDLQGRVEISYFTWSASEFGVSVDFTRIPIDVGGRFYLPVGSQNMKVFVQGMAELSFDTVEANVPFFGKTSASETHFGIVPGAGIDIKLSPGLSFVADARWHIITDDYFTIQAGVAAHF